MSTYVTRVRVPDDGLITVRLPSGMGVGKEVTVSVEEPPSADEQLQPWTGEEFLAWLEARRGLPKPWPKRTREEIDADLNAMRDEWDNR